MGYLNLVGSFLYKEPLFRAKLAALAGNDAQLKTDGWAQNTKTIFYQAAVPTGWTQDVSQNDKALRVVAATGGGSGGATGLSSTITLAHTHAITADDSHTHSYPGHTHGIAGGNGGSNFGNPTDFYDVSFQRISLTGSSSVNQAKNVFNDAGNQVLSTLAAHDHGGVTDSQLTDTSIAYCDVIVGTKNAPGGTYTDLTSYWSTGSKIDFDPFSASAANDSYLNGILMPAGSISLFAQGSAPTGWTKISSVDDRFLRVVSGAGGVVGGVSPVSSGLALMHTHAVTATADHTHSIASHGHTGVQVKGTLTNVQAWPDTAARYIQDDGAGHMVQSGVSGPTASRTTYISDTNSTSASTLAAGGHTHVLPNQLTTIFFNYVDVIQCSKDSSGAPYSYTDMTSSFSWKNLVSYQRLNSLATNDAYVQYHTTPIGSDMVFFMVSPPTGWIQNTMFTDIGLRMVSGSSGGTVGGGSQGISQTIPLAHTHTIPAGGGHTHLDTHTHTIATAPETAYAPTAVIIEGRAGGGLASGHSGFAIIQSTGGLTNLAGGPSEIITGDPDHSHGAVTDSKLSDVTLAYADLIWCSKS